MSGLNLQSTEGSDIMDDETMDKARIKITGFRTNDEVQKFPLKLFVFSEFSPRDIQEGISQISKRYSIDKDKFKGVMSELAEQVTVSVHNYLSEQPENLIITIPLRDINSFRPESIAENVVELSELLETRELLYHLKERRISKEEFQARLDRSAIGSEINERVRSILFTPQPKQKQTQTEKDAYDKLFEMVEVPESSITSADKIMDRVISLFTSSKDIYEDIDFSLVSPIISDIDKLLNKQVNEILHHKEIRRLESVWRGLKFLIDRTDFREDIQIEIMSVPKSDLVSAFHENIYLPMYESTLESPISAVIADYEFDRTAKDIEILMNLSSYAEMAQVPVITSICSEFFGIDSADELNRLPYLGEILKRSEYVKWNGFRESESSRWIMVVFNRFLLRLPYGNDNRTKRFNFIETEPAYLWGNAVWGVSSLLTSSFARIGWATEIIGMRNGVIPDLPIHPYITKAKEEIYIPLETHLSIQMHSDLADNGISALTCRPNSDFAVLLSAPMVHIPEKYSEKSITEKSILRTTLPYQILVARIANYITIIQDKIVPGNTEVGIEESLTNALINFLSIDGSTIIESIKVIVSVSQERPGYYDISVNISLGKEIMNGMADVDLNWQTRIL